MIRLELRLMVRVMITLFFQYQKPILLGKITVTMLGVGLRLELSLSEELFFPETCVN